jgi:vancomycin resistance protein YoaR
VIACYCRSYRSTRWLVCLAVVLLVPGPAGAARPENARQQVPPRKAPLDVPIRLTDGVRTVVRTRRELGFQLASRPGQPVAFIIDKRALSGALRRLAPKYQQVAVNARPYVYHGQLQISRGSYSRTLSVPPSVARLAAVVAGNSAAVRFNVVLDKKPPVLTAERLKGIAGVLGTYATRTTANPKRNKNIRLAAHSIDGILLSPGETFSLRETIGKPTQASGYQTAPVFLNAETVPGIGGGISQVTGTLFNAAALAGLKIVEVHPHSRPVSYLPVGRDATFSYGTKDLKLVNTTGGPVYLAYSFQSRRLHATVYGGKQPGRKVTLEVRVQRLGPGKVNAQLYRVVRQNGRVIAKERLVEHAYRWDPRSRGV